MRLFPIPFALWLVVTAAWFFGAEGLSFRTNTGQKATIDFNRKYDSSARMLTADLAVLSDGDGALVKLKRAWIPYCWLCGTHVLDGTLVQFATHQRGPWIYRVPAPDPNFKGWTNQRGIAAALVLAYDLNTGEVLSAPRDSSVDAKRALLESKGLTVDDGLLIKREGLEPASLLSEGCAIVQTAFFIILTIWSLGFGVAFLVKKKRGDGNQG